MKPSVLNTGIVVVAINPACRMGDDGQLVLDRSLGQTLSAEQEAACHDGAAVLGSLEHGSLLNGEAMAWAAQRPFGVAASAAYVRAIRRDRASQPESGRGVMPVPTLPASVQEFQPDPGETSGDAFARQARALAERGTPVIFTAAGFEELADVPGVALDEENGRLAYWQFGLTLLSVH